MISLRVVTIHFLSFISLNCSLELLKIFSLHKKMLAILYTHSEGNHNCRVNPGKLLGTYLAYLCVYICQTFVAGLLVVDTVPGVWDKEKAPRGEENDWNEANTFLQGQGEKCTCLSRWYELGLWKSLMTQTWLSENGFGIGPLVECLPLSRKSVNIHLINE